MTTTTTRTNDAGFGVRCNHYGERVARVTKVNRRTLCVAGRFKDGRCWTKKISVSECELNIWTAQTVCSAWLRAHTAHDGSMLELVLKQRDHGYLPTFTCDDALDVLVADWYDRTARKHLGDCARSCYRIGKAKGGAR